MLSKNSSENAAIKDLIEIIASKKRNKESNIKLKCQCVPKIMLVDDNDFNLMPLNLLISQLFQIKTELAFNGQQAINLFVENYEKTCKCENRGFKFIFMDLNMPEVWKSVKANVLIIRGEGDFEAFSNKDHEDIVNIVIS